MSLSDAYQIWKRLTCSRHVNGIRGPLGEISESCVVGLSTGLLAAATVALSPAIPTLIPLAIEVVLIAFRVGLHVETAAKNLVTSASLMTDTWSYVIPGKTEDEALAALAAFNETKVRSTDRIRGQR